jgi:hypothetical protein
MFLLAACAHSVPHVSSMNFSSADMWIMGPATGESTRDFILCAIPQDSTGASVAEATRNAVATVNADALINTVVDDERGIGFLGLWCWQTIRVSGTAVRFKSNAWEGGARPQPSVPTPAPTQNQNAQPTPRKSGGLFHLIFG